jgi:hypothetical protein
MAIVLHGLVTATGTVGMGVTFVSYVGLRHGNSPFVTRTGVAASSCISMNTAVAFPCAR